MPMGIACGFVFAGFFLIIGQQFSFEDAFCRRCQTKL